MVEIETKPVLDRQQLEILAAVAEDNLWNLLLERFDEYSAKTGCTRVQLANRMGVPAQQISRWFNGPQNIGIDNAAMLFAAMESDLCVSFIDWEGLKHTNHCHEVESARISQFATRPLATLSVDGNRPKRKQDHLTFSLETR